MLKGIFHTFITQEKPQQSFVPSLPRWFQGQGGMQPLVTLCGGCTSGCRGDFTGEAVPKKKKKKSPK